MDFKSPIIEQDVAQFSRRAFKWLEQHQLSFLPVHYAVAFAYISEQYPSLNQAIDNFIARHPFVDSYTVKSWYQLYIAQNPTQSAPIAEGLDNLIGYLKSLLQESGATVKEYLATLDTQSNELKQIETLKNAQNILNTILSATQLVQQKQSDVHQQISDSHGEIEQLRKELDNMQKQAFTDPLTLLNNRRSLEQFIQQLKSSRTVSILMLDVDHFKSLNDRFGHLVGDIVLVKIAELIRQNLAEDCHAFRYGGEEFLVICENLSPNKVFELAENIRQEVESLKLVYSKTQERLPNMTISIGLAFAKDNEPNDQLIHRADKALYAAKHGGRNTVSVSS